MKKIILFLLIWMSVQPLFMQEKQVYVELLEKIPDHFGSDSLAYTSTELIFPKPVYRVSISPEKNLLIVELRDIGKRSKRPKMSGLVVIYDLTHKKTLWSMKSDYARHRVIVSSDKLLLSSAPETIAYDLYTGDKLWRSTEYLYDVYPEQNMALVQHNGQMGTLDLTTGRRLWLNSLNNTSGINDFFLYDDSTLMIVSDGLHSRNIYNGQGWDYKMKTSMTDYTPVVVGSLLGIFFRPILGRTFIEAEPVRVTDMISNVCYDNHCFYFAGRDQLVSLTENGVLNWSVALPDKTAAQSTLLVNEESLFMLNRGFAYEDGVRTRAGMPYLACFELKSGEKRYFTQMDRESLVLDWVLHGDTMALLMDRKIKSVYLKEGAVLNENPLGLNKSESVVGFVNTKLCKAMADSLWNNLVDISPDHYFVVTNQDRILEYGADLQLLKSYSSKDLYMQYFDNPDLRFIANDNHSIVINNLGESVADFPANERSIVVGSRLVSFGDNRISIINLQKLLK